MILFCAWCGFSQSLTWSAPGGCVLRWYITLHTSSSDNTVNVPRLNIPQPSLTNTLRVCMCKLVYAHLCLLPFYHRVALTTVPLCSLSFVTLPSGNRMKSFVWSGLFCGPRKKQNTFKKWDEILHFNYECLSKKNNNKKKIPIFFTFVNIHESVTYRIPWSRFLFQSCLFPEENMKFFVPLILKEKKNTNMMAPRAISRRENSQKCPLANWRLTYVSWKEPPLRQFDIWMQQIEAALWGRPCGLCR